MPLTQVIRAGFSRTSAPLSRNGLVLEKNRGFPKGTCETRRVKRGFEHTAYEKRLFITIIQAEKSQAVKSSLTGNSYQTAKNLGFLKNNDYEENSGIKGLL